MTQCLGMLSLIVDDYDKALDYYISVLGFELIEDTPLPEDSKRWVVVCPPGDRGASLLLARAKNQDQSSRIGNQTGGRVFLFLYTDNFQRDYELYHSRGVNFLRGPSDEPYGRVAVFADLYGNQWDLIEPTPVSYSLAKIC